MALSFWTSAMRQLMLPYCPGRCPIFQVPPGNWLLNTQRTAPSQLRATKKVIPSGPLLCAPAQGRSLSEQRILSMPHISPLSLPPGLSFLSFFCYSRYSLLVFLGGLLRPPSKKPPISTALPVNIIHHYSLSFLQFSYGFLYVQPLITATVFSFFTGSIKSSC